MKLPHWLEYITFLLWIWLAPIRPALLCVMLLPLIDLSLALIVAKKTGHDWTSSGWRRTITKILIYEAATVLAFMVETYLTGPLIPAIKGVTGLIGMTELKSCLEHLDDLNGGNFFKTVIDKLSSPGEDK